MWPAQERAYVCEQLENVQPSLSEGRSDEGQRECELQAATKPCVVGREFPEVPSGWRTVRSLVFSAYSLVRAVVYVINMPPFHSYANISVNDCHV